MDKERTGAIEGLSKLRGIDKLEGASEEIEKIRKEWDEEFEKGIET